MAFGGYYFFFNWTWMLEDMGLSLLAAIGPLHRHENKPLWIRVEPRVREKPDLKIIVWAPVFTALKRSE